MKKATETGRTDEMATKWVKDGEVVEVVEVDEGVVKVLGTDGLVAEWPSFRVAEMAWDEPVVEDEEVW